MLDYVLTFRQSIWCTFRCYVLSTVPVWLGVLSTQGPRDIMSFCHSVLSIQCLFDTVSFRHSDFSTYFFSKVLFLHSALPTQCPFNTGSVLSTECPFGIVYFQDSVRSTSVFRHSVVGRSVVRWSFCWSSNTFAGRSWAHEDMCLRLVPKDTSKDTCLWRRNNGNVQNSRVWPSWTLAKRSRRICALGTEQ